jgi:hypothetical protein
MDTQTEDRTARITSPPVDGGGDAPPPSVVVVLVILFAMLMAVAVSLVVWRVPPPKD